MNRLQSANAMRPRSWLLHKMRQVSNDRPETPAVGPRMPGPNQRMLAANPARRDWRGK